LLTDRQTDRQTDTGKTFTSSFVGGNDLQTNRSLLYWSHNLRLDAVNNYVCNLLSANQVGIYSTILYRVVCRLRWTVTSFRVFIPGLSVRPLSSTSYSIKM